MTDFREQAQALNDVRRDKESARLALSLARDSELRGARNGAEGSRVAREAYDAQRAREREVLGTIGELSDPRRAVSTLSDSDPILLFPVRLETRFKQVTDEAGSERHELWIRIYPDDCVVDSFEVVPSDSEIAAAKIYWQNVWRAGGDQAGEKSTWRQLVGSSGPGRAAWLVRNYQPVNEAQHPAKLTPEETLLIAGSEVSPSQQVFQALGDYWAAVWRAGTNGTKVEAARQALIGQLGTAAAADSAIAAYKPFNLKDPVPQQPVNQPPPVRFFIVQFPDSQSLATQRFSWGSAPKSHLLPDRFVAIAFDSLPSAGATPAFTVVGEPVPSPLILGIDPNAPKGEQLDEANGDIRFGDDLAWMIDFEKAVASGMGLRVPITSQQARDGFARLIVLGIRATANAAEGRHLLEELFAHHRDGRTGFALLPQGAATNNVEERPADFRLEADAEQAFSLTFTDAGVPVAGPSWTEQRDGARLAAALAVGIDSLTGVAGVNGTDQLEARRMHQALFPGSLGYFLHDMIGETITAETFDAIRTFFLDWVAGRGPIPAIRIGSQPYGVLPTTVFSRLSFAGPEGGHILNGGQEAFLERLAGVLRAAERDWSQMAEQACWVGRGGDPHLTLLDTLGLQPASAEFYRRTAESIEEQLNRLNLVGPRRGVDLPHVLEAIFRREEIPNLLQQRGIPASAEMPISDRIFSGRQFRLSGPVVDDAPLSEIDPIRPYTTDGRNYLAWLADAALSDMDILRRQTGFLDDTPPRALLYIILRFALLSGYRHEATDRFLVAQAIDAAAAATFRRDPSFVHVKEKAASESRWSQLYTPASEIGVQGNMRVHEVIAAALRANQVDVALADQVRAIGGLASLPTARLERLFIEHVDCLSYRVDAWRTGLASRRLSELRSREGEDQGILLGAYGWVENLRPRTPPQPFDPPSDVAGKFTGPGLGSLSIDPTNQGFVHAPSLDHAVTAAILRNGHISMADPSSGEELAINLSSERVRRALAMFQGMSEGQSLSALLGYQLERGLHERHPGLELDKFIQPLRNNFPLDANRIPETAEPAGAQESIAARNVVDGRKLAARVQSLPESNRGYPFEITSLPGATTDERASIDVEVDRLLDTLDAVADLALAESVHQSARGNFDRAAGMLDAFSRGTAPPEPELTRTPRSGTTLTHRIAIHFDPVVQAPPVVTPRSTAEPRLDQWLRAILPPLEDVACSVTYFDQTQNAISDPVRISLSDLALAAIDVVALEPESGEQQLTAFDELVLSHLEAAHSVAPDGPVNIDYVERFDDNTITLFELMPLVSSLRALLSKARPAGTVDLAPPSNPYPDPLGTITADAAPIRAQLIPLKQIADDCADLKGDAEDAAKPPNDPLTAIDSLADRLIDLSRRAGFFGLPTSGIALVRDARRDIFGRIRTISSDIGVRWTISLGQANESLDAEATLAADPASSADDRRAMLRKAESLVSSSQALADTTPDPAALRPEVLTKRDAFAAKLAEFEALSRTTAATLKQVRGEAAAILPITDFESSKPPFDDVDGAIMRLCVDIARAAGALGTEAKTRLDSANAEMDQCDTAARDTDRAAALRAAAKAIFGEWFHTLAGAHLSDTPRDDGSGVTQRADWTAAIAASGPTGILHHLVKDLRRFDPVEEWLAGIARVRSPMKQFERMLILAEGFGANAMGLTAYQLPYAAGDSWLGAEFPSTQDLTKDRLLYCALIPSGGWDPDQPVFALVVDEWVETLPNASEMTGLTFHYDRPNSEPPQSLLLVVPPVRTGAWRWNDIVDAVAETFELARQRAVEPAHIDNSSYARLLPTILFATAQSEITPVVDLSMNNLVGFTVASQ